MGNYATVTEIRNFKVAGQTVDLGAFSDAEIEAEIAVVESLIEAITGDVFYLEEAATKVFDGKGVTKLFFLPDYLGRLVSIDSVTEVDLDGTTVLDTFIEDEDFKRYDYYLDTAQEFDGDSPRRRFGTGGRWPKGQKNIVIVGDWGRATTPPEISKVTKQMVLEGLLPGSSGVTPKDYKQVVWSDFTTTFKGAEEHKGTSTGFPDFDRVLQLHVNYVDMFQVLGDERGAYDSILGDGAGF